MLDWIYDFEGKKNEEFLIFINKWLEYELEYRSELYSDVFIQASYKELEENPFAPAGLNCHIVPLVCIEEFYNSVNSRIPSNDRFDFNQHISSEYYEEYDDCFFCFLGYWDLNFFSENAKRYCFLHPLDIKEYYNYIDNLLDEYKGKVYTTKALKKAILQECIDFRQNDLDNPDSYIFIDKNRDWISLEIYAIKSQMDKIERSHAMELPINSCEINLINELDNWIKYIQDRDNRYSVKRLAKYVEIFLDRAFKKDDWQRYLLNKLGVEKSKSYFLAREGYTHLPFPPTIIND